MTSREIRAEVIELYSGGLNKVSDFVAYFKKYKPDADIKTVRSEAREIIKQNKY
ncbi:MAG: hypothetical protein ACFFKA_00170 [Candidatus Thorarchaeota archaeon]